VIRLTRGVALGFAWYSCFLSGSTLATLWPSPEWAADVLLACDRFTAILELVSPFTLPVMGLSLIGMCLGTHLRCRELRSELESV
jgi:hypothetical protein